MKTHSSDGRASRAAGEALDARFYERPVLEVAREMIGCTVVHGATAGVIVETEAYHESEPACHAFVGLTPRTSTLFGKPGVAYVYRSYGIHAMLNAVCEPEGVAAAVLIRALEPTSGIESMRLRRGLASGASVKELCSGPGKLCQALAVTGAHTGALYDQPPFALFAAESALDLAVGPRIGLTKAVDTPWRFGAAGSRFLSRPFPRVAA